MTQRIFTELSWEPLSDAFWSTQIYLEIEDDSLETVSQFMANYPKNRSLDLTDLSEQPALSDFLDALRAHPNVLKAEECSFFWPFKE